MLFKCEHIYLFYLIVIWVPPADFCLFWCFNLLEMAATTASSMHIATVKPRAFASQKDSKSSIANFGTDIKGASWTNLKSSFHISSTRPFSHSLASTAVKFQRVITKAMSENSEMKPLSGLPIDLRG